MTHKIIEDESGRLVIIRFSGTLDDEAMLEMREELYLMSSHAKADQFIDFSGVVKFDVTFDGATDYSETAIERPESLAADAGRKMVVLAPGDLAFGMSRFMATKAEQAGFNFMVFRDMESAKEYLGSDPSEQKSEQNGQS